MASQTITALGNAIINLIKRRTPIATANTVGMVKPDGSTINIDANGVISAGSGGGQSNNILDFKWSDHLLNDMSWLRADTFSWQDGTTYSQAYNELLSEYNNSASVTQTEEKKWVQPILTANGTLGGSSFAVSTDNPYSDREAYMSFDGNYATKWGKKNTTAGNLIFYNPTKIKITKITQTPVSDYPQEDYGTYTLYGSNDNSTWTQLCRITVEASKSAEYIPTNPDFYNYYKINQSGGHNYAGTGELTITATELVGTITYKRTPKGYKIALATQETAIAEKYTTDGIAWYYILDTTNKKFKLPRAKHPSLVTLTSTAPVVGNGKALGYTNGTIEGVWGNTNGWGNGDSRYFCSGLLEKSLPVPVGTSLGFGVSSFPYAHAIGVTTDPTKSGLVADLSSNVKDYNMYLYFYVGGFTKSAEAQTAGLKAELLNGKADVTTPSIQAPYLKDTYQNGTSGYRIWSDGYCEQWGDLAANVSKLTFLKPFANTNYTFTIYMDSANNQYAYASLEYYLTSKTKTGITKNAGDSLHWKACGYIA